MSNALWLGILIGVPVGAFAPGWLKPIVWVVALVLSDLVHTQNVQNVQGLHFAIPPWLIGLLGVLFGLWSWHYARKRGLQHLGQAELRTRWAAARGISKWGW